MAGPAKVNCSETTPHTRSNARGLVGWKRVKGYLRVGTSDRQTDRQTKIQRTNKTERMTGVVGAFKGTCVIVQVDGGAIFTIPPPYSKLKVTWNMVHGTWCCLISLPSHRCGPHLFLYSVCLHTWAFTPIPTVNGCRFVAWNLFAIFWKGFPEGLPYHSQFLDVNFEGDCGSRPMGESHFSPR